MDTKIAELKVNMVSNEEKIVKNIEIISDVQSIVEGHSAKISSLSEAVEQQEKSTESGDCNVRAEDRQDCGYPGITKEACNAKGCCFNNQQKNTFWCFTPKQTGDVTTLTEGKVIGINLGINLNLFLIPELKNYVVSSRYVTTLHCIDTLRLAHPALNALKVIGGYRWLVLAPVKILFWIWGFCWDLGALLGQGNLDLGLGLTVIV